MSYDLNLQAYQNCDGFGKNEFIDDNGNKVTMITYYDEDGNKITRTVKESQDEWGSHIIDEQIKECLTNGQTINVPAHKRSMAKALNGGAQQAPTDNGLSTGAKTPEQEANLAKLAAARTYLAGENGQALEQLVSNANFTLTRKQKKELKKQGVDPDAFLQALNEKNSKVRYNAEQAADKRDDMGALANTFLGERTEEARNGRQPKRNDEVATDEKRGFLKKLFTQKQKQNVKDSQKYAESGGSKVKIHSTTADEGRNPDLHLDISDESAKAGNEYLDAFKDGYKGKKREKFKEIDENGNQQKVKVVYTKDGNVKKVVTKSNDKGKLVVKEAKDGHITIKGDLQSDKIMEGPSTKEIQGSITKEYTHKEYHIENCDKNVPEPEPPTPPTPPVPPVPPVPPPPPVPPVPPIKIEKKPGGLVQDIHNGVKTTGIGQVTGSEIRSEFKQYGAEAMVKAYCSYNDTNAPIDAKTHSVKNNNQLYKKENGHYVKLSRSEISKMKFANSGFYANTINAKHITFDLIDSIEKGQIDEKSLGQWISALRKHGKTAELKAVKKAILEHNASMKRSEHLHSDATRTVTSQVSKKDLAVNWLLSASNL